MIDDISSIPPTNSRMIDGITEGEWNAAEDHFFGVIRNYRAIANDPQVHVRFAWEVTFKPILFRWFNGEVSRELLNDMMEVK